MYWLGSLFPFVLYTYVYIYIGFLVWEFLSCFVLFLGCVSQRASPSLGATGFVTDFAGVCVCVCVCGLVASSERFSLAEGDFIVRLCTATKSLRGFEASAVLAF